MGELVRWVPAIVAVVSLVGIGAVVNATVNRHENGLSALKDDVQELKTKVAVLEATRKGGE